MKKIIIAIVTLIIVGVSCSKNSPSNQNSLNGVNVPNLDFVGPPIAGMIYNLNGHQIEEDLLQDSWMGYMNTGPPLMVM